MLGGGMNSVPEAEIDVVSDGETGAVQRALGHWKLVAVAIITFAADQLTKYVVRENLRLGESWPEEGFFRLTHGTNTGSAFGLFQDYTFVLTIASILAIGFVLYFYKKEASSMSLPWLTAGLILGGAFGNLLDRVIAGTVTDFIDVGPWPIFNVADSSIVVGIIALATSVFLAGGRKTETADQTNTEVLSPEEQ